MIVRSGAPTKTAGTETTRRRRRSGPLRQSRTAVRIPTGRGALGFPHFADPRQRLHGSTRPPAHHHRARNRSALHRLPRNRCSSSDGPPRVILSLSVSHAPIGTDPRQSHQQIYPSRPLDDHDAATQSDPPSSGTMFGSRHWLPSGAAEAFSRTPGRAWTCRSRAPAGAFRGGDCAAPLQRSDLALDENELVTDHWPFLELVS